MAQRRKAYFVVIWLKRTLKVASLCNNSLDVFPSNSYVEKTERRDCGALVLAYRSSFVMQNCLLHIWFASMWKCSNLLLNLQNVKWGISFVQETAVFCLWTDNVSSRIINTEYNLFLRAGELGENRVKIKAARHLGLKHTVQRTRRKSPTSTFSCYTWSAAASPSVV